jgi:AraC-like DNA-binding protein
VAGGQHRRVSGEHEELLTSIRQAALAVRQAREAQREALRAGHALGIDVADLAAEAGMSESEAHRVITRIPVT